MTPQRQTGSEPHQRKQAIHLLDVPGLAEQLGVTERFVRRLIAERRVPFCKIGKFVRFDPHEIEEWIDRQRVAAFERN